MKHALSKSSSYCAILTLALAGLVCLQGCKESAPEVAKNPPSLQQGTHPEPVATPAPAPSRAVEIVPQSDIDIFLRQHGTAYDPLSRVSRAKMQSIIDRHPAPGPLANPSPAPKAPVVVSTPVKLPDPTPAPVERRRRVIQIAESLVGQKETHGSNRSPLIDKMNSLTGVPLGSPWCASFNAYIYHEAGVPRSLGWPLSAWSPSWVVRPTWTRAKGGKDPLPGAAFGIYYQNLKRIGHTGLIESWGASVVTIEGNTGPSGSIGNADRDGDGSYKKRRLRSQIHSARDWLL